MNRLTSVIAEALGLDASDVTPQLALHNAETWTSLTHIELIVSLEEAFAIEFTDDEIVAMTSVRAIRELLSGRGVSPE